VRADLPKILAGAAAILAEIYKFNKGKTMADVNANGALVYI